MWRDRINGALRATTGYQLQRPLTVQEQQAALQAAAEAQAERQAQRKAQRQAARRAARAGASPRTAPRKRTPPPPNPQYDEAARQIIMRVKPRTMTGDVKLYGLVAAARYVVQHQVPGDVVECGVWRGGSMQAAALALAEAGDTSRHLHLFDTFEGMPPAGEEDLRYDGTPAADLLADAPRTRPVWALAPLEDVQEGMAELPYPQEQIHYHRGLVEDTVPEHAPGTIAILRLDTDWYASTKHELEHLYSRLSPGGVLIIDDYAYWHGSGQATDEWLAETGEPLLLLPADSGRIAVKPFGR